MGDMCEICKENPAKISISCRFWMMHLKERRRISFDENYRIQMQYMFGKLRTILGNAGASANVAKYIIGDLEK